MDENVLGGLDDGQGVYPKAVGLYVMSKGCRGLCDVWDVGGCRSS